MFTGDKVENTASIALSSGIKSPSNEFYFITNNVNKTDILFRLSQFNKIAKNTVLVLDGRDWPAVPLDMREIAEGAALVVWSKADLVADGKHHPTDSAGALAVSSKTGMGLDALRQTLLKLARERLSGGEAAVITRQRHRAALESVRNLLGEWSSNLEPEVQAHLIHQANREISKILGRSDIEDVLDLIFSEFCIGK